MTLHLPQKPMATYTTGKFSTFFKCAASLFALAILLVTPLSFAEIYRWTDAQGKTHFSEHPPEDQVPSEEISSQLSPLNRDSSTDETKKLQQLFKGPTPEEQALQQQQQAQQQKRDQQISQICDKARERLKTLKGPVFFTDDNGDKIVVTEEERQQRVIQLEQEIRQHCP